MDDNKPAQAIIAPFAICLTAFFWVGTCAEILTRGAYHSLDLSKVYLGTMTAYATVAEFNKWLNSAPTDPSLDPQLERIHRGGFFVWLWLVPLLICYVWHFMDATVLIPGPLEKTTLGLIGIFFLKAGSRRWRHQKHGVINPATGEVQAGAAAQDGEQDADFAEALFQKISAPSGASILEMTAAFPNVSRPSLYRALDKLTKTNRVTRTGKPRTPDVRYHATHKG